METLAAFGALLRVRCEQLAPDLRVGGALERGVGVIESGLLTAATPQEEAVTVGYTCAVFPQALDLGAIVHS